MGIPKTKSKELLLLEGFLSLTSVPVLHKSKGISPGFFLEVEIRDGPEFPENLLEVTLSDLS